MSYLKNILFALLFLISLTISAQDFKVEDGPVLNKKNKTDLYKTVFADAYGFSMYHFSKPKIADFTRNITVTNYNQSMEKIDDYKFDLPNLDKRIGDLLDVIEFDDKLVFLTKTNSKKLAKHEVNAQVYSKKMKSVNDTKVLSTFAIEGYGKSGFYQTAISPDKSKFVIYANMPFEKKTNEKIKIWVYDTDLNLIWETSKELDFDSKRAYSEKVFITNTGKVVVNKTLNELKKNRATYSLQFTKNDFKKVDLSTPDFYPNDYVIREVNGESVFCGFFWNLKNATIRFDDKQNTIDNGVFVYNIDQNKIIAQHLWESSEFSYKDSSDLIVTDCFIGNKSITVLGEKSYVKSEFKVVDGKPTAKLEDKFTHGNTIIIELEFNGTLKNITSNNAEKIVYTGEEVLERGLSTFVIDDALYVFDNENKTYEYISVLKIKSFFDNNEIRVNKYFDQKELPINIAKVPSTIVSAIYVNTHLLPATMAKVKDFNVIYFMTVYDAIYKINKMTW